MPWPDLKGLRCLDVGPYDGFLSFEMERRGASEVIAVDIATPTDWDWPFAYRESGPPAVGQISGERTGGGFRTAKRIMDSRVERLEISAYDLDPREIGTFDFVICGSLMLHLRDPIRALESIRSVCGGQFLSAETISPRLSSQLRAKPVARFIGDDSCQWWVPNVAGHRHMLEAAGFRVVQTVKPYAIPYGTAHPALSNSIRARAQRFLARRVIGGVGVPHSASLCEVDYASGGTRLASD